MSDRSRSEFDQDVPDTTKERIDEGAEEIGEDVARRFPGGVSSIVRQLFGRNSK